jgi:hypothetical protein
MSDASPVAPRPRSPVAALLYLYRQTARNRLRLQLRRVRSPRYLAAVLLGALYLWWALFRNTRIGSTPLTALLHSETTLVLGSAVLLLSSARWWLFGGDRSALAFTPAEVQFLFPAPISRRALIHAKLARLQLAILINTIIFTVIFRGEAGSFASWQRALALWTIFSTLSLHRLGATIVRTNAMEHGSAGARRGVVPTALFAVLLGAIGYGLVAAVPALRLAGPGGLRSILQTITAALHAPAPAAALAPVRMLLDPVALAGSPGWFAAIGWALVILLIHYLWVARLDEAFEEAALEATQHRADRLHRARAAQIGQARTRSGKLARIPRLALSGRPEVALVWKNVAAALRGGSWKSQVVSFTIGLAILAAVTRSASSDVGDAFLGVTIGWGVMLLFLGPLWMRFDLRLDLPRLAMLKTMPLAGWRIVTAEIVAVTILHSITVWSLMAVPAVMFAQDPTLFAASGATIPILVSIVVGVPVFNALMFTIQNGTALLFPAWVRLGAENRGFETMGQNLLTTGATTIAAAVALVFPAGTGLLVLWWTNDWNGWSVLTATAAASTVILLELFPVLRWLGTVFDETDVREVAAAG